MTAYNEQSRPKRLVPLFVEEEDLKFLYIYNNNCYVSLTDTIEETDAEEIELDDYVDPRIDVYRDKQVHAITYRSSASMKLCCVIVNGKKVYKAVPKDQPCPS